MRTGTSRRTVFGGLVLGLALATAPVQAKEGEQQALVDAATKTLNVIMADKDMGWLRANIGRAKGVIIAPSVVKAGFVFGGSGGIAVMLVRKDKAMAGPAFYKLGTASIGFQAGASDSQVLTLVMTEKAVKNVLKGNFKVGGDVSAAAGPVGAGAKSDVDADFITFARSKGLYGGLNFEGTKIEAHDDWNKKYNGATAVAVLTGTARANPDSATLLATARKFMK